MRFVVVLPAYNEEKDLPPLLQRIGKALPHTSFDYKVLVVDDGSSDRTAEVAVDPANECPVQLVRHPKNMGLGAAIRTGLMEAMAEEQIVITMDADNSHDPALIPAMLKKIAEGYDVVIASRFQPGGEEVGVAGHRKLLSHAAGAMMRIIVRYPNVKDYSCGYRAYTPAILRELVRCYGGNFLKENGFACMLELLLKLKNVGARASEVPLVLRYDMKSGSSKMRVGRTIARYGSVIWDAYTSRRGLSHA